MDVDTLAEMELELEEFFNEYPTARVYANSLKLNIIHLDDPADQLYYIIHKINENIEEFTGIPRHTLEEIALFERSQKNENDELDKIGDYLWFNL